MTFDHPPDTEPRPDFKVLLTGALPLDILAYVDRLDSSGQIAIERVGGSVGNAGTALRRLGASCTIAGAIGADPEAETVRQTMERDGLDTRYVEELPGRPTRRIVFEIRREADGTVSHRGIHPSGSLPPAAPGDISTGAWSSEAISNHHWFHFDAANRATVKIARDAASAGKVVSYDFGYQPRGSVSRILPLLEQCHVIQTNRHLAPLLSLGAPPSSLLGRYPKLRFLLITDGDRGLEIFWRNGTIRRKLRRATIPAPRVIDTIGAGDACTALLIWSLRKMAFQNPEDIRFDEKQVRETLDAMAAVSALACQFPGANGYLTWAAQKDWKLEDLIREIVTAEEVPETWHVPPEVWVREY
ncbi:hypothetical protein HQ520_12140 [bacterium]|nr:hypothetical protein [bacterium]